MSEASDFTVAGQSTVPTYRTFKGSFEWPDSRPSFTVAQIATVREITVMRFRERPNIFYNLKRME